MPIPDSDIERIMVVSAHPDDVDFGAAGTIAQWTQKGIDVHYCIVTDGDAGGFDPAVPRKEIPGIRRAEQTAAAEAVGVNKLTFLGYPDGRLEATIDLRRDLARVIRQVKPQRVVCQSSQRNYERIYASHPDHLAAGEASLCAVYPDARNPFAHIELAAEGLEEHTVQEVWIMASPYNQLNYFVDITDTFDRKLAALMCHESQLTEPENLEPMLREWLGRAAEMGGLPEGRLAEAFQVVVTG